jgi:hypothetical protein
MHLGFESSQQCKGSLACLSHFTRCRSNSLLHMGCLGLGTPGFSWTGGGLHTVNLWSRATAMQASVGEALPGSVIRSHGDFGGVLV